MDDTNKVNTGKNNKAFYSGIVSGLVTSILCNPLEVLRTRKQVNSSPPKISNYYRGFSANTLALPTFWSIYFGMHYDNGYDPWTSACVGSFVSSPFWVVKSRMQAGINGNVMDILRERYLTHGIKGWYQGLGLTVIYNLQMIIMMPIYEYTKNKTRDFGTPISIILASIISKTIAGAVVYPIDTIRTNIRIDKRIHYNQYFRGFSYYLLRTLPFSISIFSSYELNRRFFFH